VVTNDHVNSRHSAPFLATSKYQLLAGNMGMAWR
jgi:hypothetical protein